MRVCTFGAYDPAYSRNAILREGLRRNGVEVVECRISPRTPIALRPAALMARFARLAHRRFDAFLVVELNPEVVWLARLLGAPWRTPVVFDIFFSKYDALVHDRRTSSPRSPRARLLRCFEKAAVRTANVVLADTAAHADYYRTTFSASKTRFDILPVGADDRVFHPVTEPAAEGPLLVGFWGTYIPLHGIETILHAAALLRDRPIRFELIGRGQTFAEAAALAQRLELSNVSLRPPMPLAELAAFAGRCAITLGIFGETAKAARVVPHKVFQAMLTGLPVITRDSPAVREFFRDGLHLCLVPPADPKALADAIVRLAADPARRRALGQAAQQVTTEQFAIDPLGRRLTAIIKSLQF